MAINARRPSRNRITEIAAPPELPPQEHDRVISMIDLLVLFTRRRWLILKWTLACGLIALLLAFVLPKRYTARIIVMPPRENSSLSTMLSSQSEGLGAMAMLAGGLGFGNRNEMYVAMFRSEPVEDSMVRRFDLMREYHAKYLSQARKDFEKHVTIDADDKDDLIHIAVEDHDPRRAAELANGYVDQFRKLSQNLAISEASQRRIFFEQQMDQTKAQLVDAEEALKDTEQKTGVIELSSQARALIESAANLRAQIAAREAQLEMMRSYATSQNPGMTEAEQELAGLRAQLARLGGNESDLGAGLIAPKGVLPQIGVEYLRRLRDVKYYETIFEVLARQYELAKLDEAREGALIQIVGPAAIPDRRSFPQRGLFVAAGLAFGFIAGFILAFVYASLDHLRKDPDTGAKLDFLRRSYTVRKSPR